MRTINTCCFCISVQTGTLILGWLGSIGGALNCAQMLVYLFSISSFVDTMRSFLETGMSDDQFQAYMDFVEAYATMMCIMGLFIAILFTSIWVLVLLAHYKGRPSLMLPALVIQMVGLVVFALSVVIAFITMLVATQWAMILFIILFDFPVLAISFHFWHCMYSYYTILKSNNTDMHMGKTYF